MAKCRNWRETWRASKLGILKVERIWKANRQALGSLLDLRNSHKRSTRSASKWNWWAKQTEEVIKLPVTYPPSGKRMISLKTSRQHPIRCNCPASPLILPSKNGDILISSSEGFAVQKLTLDISQQHSRCSSPIAEWESVSAIVAAPARVWSPYGDRWPF